MLVICQSSATTHEVEGIVPRWPDSTTVQLREFESTGCMSASPLGSLNTVK